MNRGTLRIGVSGWRYEPWRGAFYPPGLRQDDELTYAAERLPTSPLVSVIIPVRNGAAVLPGQLKGLTNQDYDGAWEVVVVDNDSHDATVDVALAWKTKLPQLRVTTARRHGVNHARNAGATAARGDLLLFCDADDVATPSWLRAMASAASTADIVGGYLDFDTLNSPRARSARMPNPRDRLPGGDEFFPYASGGCFGVRTDVFTTLGGFNQAYASRGAEDVEFCWRAQLGSYSLGYARDAVMQCRLRDRLWPIARQSFCYGQGSARLFRDFHAHGIPPVNTRHAVEGWQWLVRHLPHLASPDRAARWTWRFGWRLGLLVGSLRYWVWCP